MIDDRFAALRAAVERRIALGDEFLWVSVPTIRALLDAADTMTNRWFNINCACDEQRAERIAALRIDRVALEQVREAAASLERWAGHVDGAGPLFETLERAIARAEAEKVAP